MLSGSYDFGGGMGNLMWRKEANKEGGEEGNSTHALPLT